MASASLGILDATFDTWNGVQCFAADISTVGWLPAFVFDAVPGAGASNSVLGVPHRWGLFRSATISGKGTSNLGKL